jgi:hypothetical protein
MYIDAEYPLRMQSFPIRQPSVISNGLAANRTQRLSSFLELCYNQLVTYYLLELTDGG